MGVDPNDLEETWEFRLYLGSLMFGLALLSYVLLAVSEGERPLVALGRAVAVAMLVAAMVVIAKILTEQQRE